MSDAHGGQLNHLPKLPLFEAQIFPEFVTFAQSADECVDCRNLGGFHRPRPNLHRKFFAIAMQTVEFQRLSARFAHSFTEDSLRGGDAPISIGFRNDQLGHRRASSRLQPNISAARIFHSEMVPTRSIAIKASSVESSIRRLCSNCWRRSFALWRRFACRADVDKARETCESTASR